MPTYCYKNTKTQETMPIVMTINEMLKSQGDTDHIEIDGEIWMRDYRGESKERVSTAKGWPMYSNSLGTHPDGVDALKAELAKKGCGDVSFHKDGGMILQNNAQRRKILKAMGKMDANGYD
jgi:hypothetical protein